MAEEPRQALTIWCYTTNWYWTWYHLVFTLYEFMSLGTTWC